MADKDKYNIITILEAIEKDEIDKDSYENYLKMEKEKTHFESTVIERRKKDKDFGKMIKNMKSGVLKTQKHMRKDYALKRLILKKN